MGEAGATVGEGEGGCTLGEAGGRGEAAFFTTGGEGGGTLGEGGGTGGGLNMEEVVVLVVVGGAFGTGGGEGGAESGGTGAGTAEFATSLLWVEAAALVALPASPSALDCRPEGRKALPALAAFSILQIYFILSEQKVSSQ